MKNYPNIMARALNTPLLLEPGYAKVFFSAMSGRLGIEQLQDEQGQLITGEKLRMSAASFAPSRDRNRSYAVHGVVGVLPVSGTLVHKSGNIQPYSGTTGYDGIIHRATEAFMDPEVKGVLLDNDTPGGEVAGCFDTAQQLRMLADQYNKPIWSLCYDMNCSAGMALASSADKRLITQTGIAGSVGVIMAHASHEAELKDKGLKVTLIRSGAHKGEGNPYEDLPEEVLARFQSQTDQLRVQFAELMAENMALSVEEILATEAAVYQGSAAIDVGFADELVNGHEAIAIFNEFLSSSGRVTVAIGANMSEKQQQPGANAADETLQGDESTVDTSANAAADERERCKAIINHEEAQGRSKLANHLAFNTSMSAEQAAEVLAASAQEEVATANAETALDKAMAGCDQPNIGAEAETKASDEDDLVAQALAAHKQATGGFSK